MRILKILMLLVLAVGAGAATLAVLYVNRLSATLPDHTHLARYEPPVTTRVHAGDGRLLAEFAVERRIYVPIGAIPKLVQNAFLSAEDQHFYQHPGIDPIGLTRAMLTNVQNLVRDRRLVGASTITQQVAKNFLLTNERSIERKLKEALIALRLEEAFGKEKILELYLNEINLGFGYGVAAAALNTFNKSLDELTVGEAAYLAALPKAPNNYHPVRHREAAIGRRNWVIGRMLEDGHITPEQAEAARAEDLVIRRRDPEAVVTADYFAEEVRRQVIEKWGEKALYEGGLSVRTSVDPALQRFANAALRGGLMNFDRRLGYRGPVARLSSLDAWQADLAKVAMPKGAEGWRLAAVLKLDAKAAEIGFADGSTAAIPFDELKWARRVNAEGRGGPAPKKPDDALDPGDVVLVEQVTPPAAKGKPEPEPVWTLRQVPEIQGALVALDPHTGRVLALSGGFSYGLSEFNRATQAMRQTGSSIKPFVYLTALDNGFTPSTLVEDGPISLDQGPGLPPWEPDNFSDDFLGQITVRVALEKSRNLVTVRLAQAAGIDKVAETAERFGIFDKMPRLMSYSLGAGQTSVLRLTAAYGMVVNGGKRIVPNVIDRVQDRNGRTVWRADARGCEGCAGTGWSDGLAVPALPDTREQVADPRTAYQLVHLLEGVVERGTATALLSLGRPVAGKTGTTNDSKETWFVGFTPDLVVGLYMGYDQPKSLGDRATGGSLAVPVFKDFMAKAMEGEPVVPFRVPSGVRMVRVDPATGRPVRFSQAGIWEPFLPGTEPAEEEAPLVDGTGYVGTDAFGNPVPAPDGTAAPAPSVTQGTGGLY
ncbi:MAG TPA: penicillin-binding protein 1A [Alphaproteobacteria bacterium]|nr:penicillin-binding protein 1A [Alphaproteobacteria bacterium]